MTGGFWKKISIPRIFQRFIHLPYIWRNRGENTGIHEISLSTSNRRRNDFLSIFDTRPPPSPPRMLLPAQKFDFYRKLKTLRAGRGRGRTCNLYGEIEAMMIPI